MKVTRKKGRLVLVGLGIKLMSHVTHETKLTIKDADKVLYISCHHLMDEYIQELNPNAESLNHFYDQEANRYQVYIKMKDRIVSSVVQDKQDICVVFYGHPCVFATPGLMAISELRKKGHAAIALPAISAEDCMFADLLIDPSSGCQSFEATDLVLHNRTIDTTAYVSLWQPAMFGNLSAKNDVDETLFKYLVHYLCKSYSAEHEVIIYSAGMYPGFKFSSKRVSLGLLKKSDFSKESSLIIPPAQTCSKNNEFSQVIALETATCE